MSEWDVLNSVRQKRTKRGFHHRTLILYSRWNKELSRLVSETSDGQVSFLSGWITSRSEQRNCTLFSNSSSKELSHLLWERKQTNKQTLFFPRFGVWDTTCSLSLSHQVTLFWYAPNIIDRDSTQPPHYSSFLIWVSDGVCFIYCKTDFITNRQAWNHQEDNNRINNGKASSCALALTRLQGSTMSRYVSYLQCLDFLGRVE